MLLTRAETARSKLHPDEWKDDFETLAAKIESIVSAERPPSRTDSSAESSTPQAREQEHARQAADDEKGAKKRRNKKEKQEKQRKRDEKKADKQAIARKRERELASEALTANIKPIGMAVGASAVAAPVAPVVEEMLDAPEIGQCAAPGCMEQSHAIRKGQVIGQYSTHAPPLSSYRRQCSS
jgi:hypothetical protein